MYHVHQNLHLLCTHMPRTLTISQHHKWHHSLPQHNGNEAINHIKVFLSKQKTYPCTLDSTCICICYDTCTAPVNSSYHKWHRTSWSVASSSSRKSYSGVFKIRGLTRKVTLQLVNSHFQFRQIGARVVTNPCLVLLPIQVVFYQSHGLIFHSCCHNSFPSLARCYQP
jgi:hypothetical protein